MSAGRMWLWGQADRQRGAGWSFAHLFPRNAAVPAIDEGHQAICGYNPARHNGVVVDEVRFRAAPDDAPRCSRCERRTHVVGKTYYPIGEHPEDSR